MKKHLITLALAGAMAGMGYADTVFNVAGGSLGTAANWSAGLPNNNVGTVAIDATTANINAAAWGTFTLNHTAGTLSSTGNHNIYGNTNGLVHQSGGSVVAATTLFANKVDYLLSGGTISVASIKSTNGAEFRQTGGTVSAKQYILLKADSIMSLTGGSATLTDAGEAFLFADTATDTITIGGGFSADITKAANLIAVGTSSGSVNFDADWAGSFTKSGTSSIDWVADLTSGDVSVGGTTVTAGNFATLFVVSGDGNTLSLVDGSLPVAVLSTPSNVVSAAFDVNIDFTEAVTGLEESDFIVSNGTLTASSLSGSGDTYTIGITPAANGNVTVRLPADSATDTDGDGNQNPDSNILTTLHLSPGSDQPTVDLSTLSSNVLGIFTVDVVFSEAVTGLALDDFLVDNGSASNLLGSGAAYTVQIVPADEGNVGVTLPANRVTDTDGDILMNTASETLVTFYDAPVSVALHGNQTTPTASYRLFLTFSEEISGLETSDFQVVNGSVSSISANGRYYEATVVAASPGNVAVTLPAGTVANLSGGTSNLVSNTLAFQSLSDFGEKWVVDSETSWTASAAATSNLTLSAGFAEPTADFAKFTSIIKSYPVKKKARNITFRQSPVWDNWADVPNVGPASQKNAPVMVSIDDGNYYFLAEGPGGTSAGYHAWHSTNMVDWVVKGPVTPPVTGHWVTSAEYKDGEFYIYSDHYNDHTPHLFKDSDLDDGIAGTLVGPAFEKETHGSDCALIRSDEDGLFHLIYEDWSPIKASANAWDSPLAGHTTSEDGFTGFEVHEHQPPVDFRTTPTGVYGTYWHPHLPGGTCTYEIHEPEEQECFGDWTSIKIGSRFYLFADYDPAGSHSMSVARFTSDSIYGEFELLGNLGSGHPDPTVCFAEGQFYLVTQQNTDHVSPGPWVAGVEARVGVDTDGDDVIDQWTAWQTVSEQYDHTPDYIRVVTMTPAQLDLSALPAGYGFQYEFRIDNTAVPGVSPIMDAVELDFQPSNFRQWANGNGIPASTTGGDHNTNGIPDIIEFTLGQTVVPERQADGSLSATVVNEAVADGVAMKLWFKNDLTLESWSVATASSDGVKLLSDTMDGEGNNNLVFEIFDTNGSHVFWKLVVVT